MTDTRERFQIFLGILDLNDCEFVEQHDRLAGRVFRRNRARIFRKELRTLIREAGGLYRVRAGNIAQAGRWPAYAPLLVDTALSYWAIAKLYAAGVLFALDGPQLISATHNAERVQRFVSSQADAASPANLPV
ncbi:MAG TPA: hypothetical protein VKS01_08335 [Bryobacteraceae bacterium]|nr:hypothetical protein [Bryobacteraceae bacterium]